MTQCMYITTPLYYVNAEPHLGSAYTMVITDAFARYYRARGYKTFFLTGTDEHGNKIAQAAEAAGHPPKAYVDKISSVFRATWQACGFAYDHFIRTTDDYHVRYVQEFLHHIHQSGDIYFGRYGGLYCFGCERFYTEKELTDGRCPDHQMAPTYIEEENYFFRMQKYQDRLVRHVEDCPEFIRPERYRNEVLAMLREPIGDLCISRPKSRLTWGIELPFNRHYVTYVWFDALINYVSALKHKGEDMFQAFWPAANHFIAKDILKPHGVYWPTMLMAAGLPLYQHLNVHGYWTAEGQKMSKSLGNVVDPLVMKDRYGMDVFRYFLLRESVFGLDADFRENSLISRYNADLANNLGNLVHRTLAMQDRYFARGVQPLGTPAAADCQLRESYDQLTRAFPSWMENLTFHRALEAVFHAVDRANKYIVETSPFVLAKDPSHLTRVGAILHNLLEALRITAQLLSPFLPETGEKIFDLLGLPPQQLSAIDLPWGEAFPPGHHVNPPVPLFPRLP